MVTYPHIKVSQPHDFTLVWFLLYNSVTLSIVFQTIRRHCYDDQPMYTPSFKLILLDILKNVHSVRVLH